MKNETVLAQTQNTHNNKAENIVDADKKNKNKRDLQPLMHLLPYLKNYKRQFTYAIISLIVAACTTLTVPLAVRRIIDNGFSVDNAQFINNYFFMMIFVVLVLAISSGTRFYYVTWIGERVVADLRADCFSHIMKLSQSFFEVTRTGEILSRLTGDTTAIKTAVGSSVSIALRNMVLFIGSIIMMIVTSLELSSLVLLAMPFIILPLIFFGRMVRTLSRKAQDYLADSSAFAGERFEAIRTVQAFAQEYNSISLFDDAVEDTFKASQKRITARMIMTVLVIFLVFASVTGIMWYGSNGVLNGTISAGTLGQFVLYAVFAASSIGMLSQVWGEVQMAAGATERLIELLDTNAEINNAENPVEINHEIKGQISFKKVSFNYPMGKNVVTIDNINLDIKQAQTVAIVGPSGSGKSTIFNLLLRFYDPIIGKVVIDDYDVKDMRLNDLRDHFSLVPQEPFIFADSVRENIRFGNNKANDDEVIRAAKLAQADEFIVNLSDGYDTILGERGVTLSGGQRQRIAIARSILHNGPILLLDEATSALDTRSEKAIQKALDEIMKKKTTLIIAHRLSTVVKADRILVIDKGKIVEDGDHESLFKSGGLYAKLAKMQFEQMDINEK